jgi:hypothetical protein
MLLLRVTRPCHVVAPTDFRDEPGGSCSWVEFPLPLLPGRVLRVLGGDADGRVFDVAGLGVVELPRGTYAPLRFPELFASVWRDAPSVVAVSRRLRRLGFRGWTAWRVWAYALRLRRDGVWLPLLLPSPSVN